jgi:ABC-type dipeptide/oligopeptide/nickel transport system permease subunit
LLSENKGSMRDSNIWIYVIAGIVLLHFIVGFIFLIRKMSNGKVEETNTKTDEHNSDELP